MPRIGLQVNKIKRENDGKEENKTNTQTPMSTFVEKKNANTQWL